MEKQNNPGINLKTIKVSEENDRKLTDMLGTLMAQTCKTQTCQSAIRALLTQSVKLPNEMISYKNV